ncbi:DUF1211 domain-containing protein [Acidobacteria bacterium AB60]|nr:DUF1211 domain-containing protein [Acidobacteria bacterium AB60]
MANETSRIEAFSDGVFSIAATLLVLELKAPAANAPFWHGLVAQWPGFAAFLLSFLFIGIMWINHHRLFQHIRRSDEFLMLTNLVLLLGVVWIPYPTSLMAQAVTRGNVRDAALLYNGSYLVIALFFNLQLAVAIHRGLVDRKYAAVRNIASSYLVGPGAYALCFLLTWWSVGLSLALNGLMALYFLLAPSAHRGVEEPRTEGEALSS